MDVFRIFIVLTIFNIGNVLEKIILVFEFLHLKNYNFEIMKLHFFNEYYIIEM